MEKWKSVIYFKKIFFVAEILVLLLYGIFVTADYRRMESIDLIQDDMQLRTADKKTVEGAYFDTSYEEIQAVVTPPLKLRKGIYYIQVSYAGRGIIRGGLIYDQNRNGQELVDNDEFEVNSTQQAFAYRVKRGDDSPVRFKLRLTGDAVEGDYVQMMECHIVPAKLTCVYRLFCMAAVLVLLNLLIFGGGVFTVLQKLANERTSSFLGNILCHADCGTAAIAKGIDAGNRSDFSFKPY